MRDSEVNISSLKVGKHSFDFQLNKAFLDQFNQGMVEGAKLEASLLLKKSETMIEAAFHINGEVVLVCDRSLEEFSEPVHVEQRIFFKFSEKFEEMSDDLMLIPYNQPFIDFGPYFYEYVALTIPIKKLHPRFRKEMEKLKEDELLIYSSGTEGAAEGEDAPADPRWEALRKLRDN